MADQEFKVYFTATFATKVKVREGEKLSDVIADIDVPENKDCSYIGISFEVQNVKDGNGERVVGWNDGPNESEEEDEEA